MPEPSYYARPRRPAIGRRKVLAGGALSAAGLIAVACGGAHNKQGQETSSPASAASAPAAAAGASAAASIRPSAAAATPAATRGTPSAGAAAGSAVQPKRGGSLPLSV